MNKWTPEWFDYIHETKKQIFNLFWDAANTIRKARYKVSFIRANKEKFAIGWDSDTGIFSDEGEYNTELYNYIIREKSHQTFPLKYIVDGKLDEEGLTEWANENYAEELKIRKERLDKKSISAKKAAKTKQDNKEQKERKELERLQKKYGKSNDKNP